MAEKSRDWYQMGRGNDYKNKGVGDTLTNIATTLKTTGAAIDAERKLEAKSKKKDRNAFATKLQNSMIEMAPKDKELGQESYQHAQNEVEALRNKMFEAIDSGDTKLQGEINIDLNQIKERHSADSENHKGIIDAFADESVSSDAMTKTNQDIMANFSSNPTKKIIYVDNKMMYEWEVPAVDEETGEPIIGEDGQPKMEKASYSPEDLQNMIVTKETVNGNKYLDLEQTFKEQIRNGGDPPSNSDIKNKIADIIPMDKLAIRDWLHGNPAEQNGLNVHGYLVDLMSRDLNTFEKLGLNLSEYPEWDINDTPGVQADEIPQDIKDKLIADVMEVKDLETSHEIITEIYAARGINNIMGVKYKEGDNGIFQGNKNYNPQDENILGSNIDQDATATEAKELRIEKLKNLGNSESLAQYNGMTPAAIAEELGFPSLDSTFFNSETGEYEGIGTYIAKATNKKANVSTGTDVDALIEKHS